ncbi:MAG TPA: nucleotide disphospho-sugar-binding domain-containing protein [Acetobacteraceae bacterium]
MLQQVNAPGRVGTEPVRVVMIPSASGGMGHVSRTATLARALRLLDPAVEVEYVLDADRLRAFNIEATVRMGYKPRLMPARHRDNRDAIARLCLGDADVIVDDTMRFLVPLRACVPQAAWVSIPMTPIGDELFMDWPFMKQMDAIIWAYAPLVGLPRDLDPVRDLVTATGPFVLVDGVPDRAASRARLGLAPDMQTVVYAPRGFPFGREFGHRVLAGAYGAVEALRRTTHPDLSLTLIAVGDPSDLHGVPGMPATLPPWVRLHGLLPQEDALMHMRAAGAVLAEGTSTMHEAAALGTPLVLVPGPIAETTLLATKLAEHGAARTLLPHDVSAARLTEAFAAVLADPAAGAAMAARALSLVSGGGGVLAAARLVLDLAARQRAQGLALRLGAA